jgi:hypothetical protein
MKVQPEFWSPVRKHSKIFRNEAQVKNCSQNASQMRKALRRSRSGLASLMMGFWLYWKVFWCLALEIPIQQPCGFALLVVRIAA